MYKVGKEYLERLRGWDASVLQPLGKAAKPTPVRIAYPGVLLEAGTRIPVPVYSEYSTRLRSNEVSSACRQMQNQKQDKRKPLFTILSLR